MVEMDFTIKGKSYRFSDRDVKKATAGVMAGRVGANRIGVEVDSVGYPARQVVLQMIRAKGDSVPDLISYQATSILRRLGYRIIDL
jgi:hypothetical protein